MKSKHSVKNIAIVAAAGSGSRMKTKENKQFLMLNGYPVLAVTLLKLSKSKLIDEIIVVARESDIVTVSKLISEYSISKITSIVPGGDTRQESVYLGLKEITDDSIVLIHDGARPFFSEDLLIELIESANKYGATAPGIVPKDTIAVVSKDGLFKEITERATLRALQTPQVFKSSLIKDAHQKAKEEKREFTDDCSLFTYYGGSVFITEGEANNIKITVPEDIPIATLLMEENEF